MNKILARQAFKSAGLKVPSGFEIVWKTDWRKQPKNFQDNAPAVGD